MNSHKILIEAKSESPILNSNSKSVSNLKNKLRIIKNDKQKIEASYSSASLLSRQLHDTPEKQGTEYISFIAKFYAQNQDLHLFLKHTFTNIIILLIIRS
jgi:hypothetical protein